MIAAVHAGWRGALKGIIRKVINYMLVKGCNEDSITAVIGPCIHQNSYNVGEDFKKNFLKKNKKNSIFFKRKKNILYFNLPHFVKSELKLNKITKIDVINIDTFVKPSRFTSVFIKKSMANFFMF